MFSPSNGSRPASPLVMMRPDSPVNVENERQKLREAGNSDRINALSAFEDNAKKQRLQLEKEQQLKIQDRENEVFEKAHILKEKLMQSQNEKLLEEQRRIKTQNEMYLEQSKEQKQHMDDFEKQKKEMLKQKEEERLRELAKNEQEAFDKALLVKKKIEENKRLQKQREEEERRLEEERREKEKAEKWKIQKMKFEKLEEERKLKRMTPAQREEYLEAKARREAEEKRKREEEEERERQRKAEEEERQRQLQLQKEREEEEARERERQHQLQLQMEEEARERERQYQREIEREQKAKEQMELEKQRLEKIRREKEERERKERQAEYERQERLKTEAEEIENWEKQRQQLMRRSKDVKERNMNNEKRRTLLLQKEEQLQQLYGDNGQLKDVNSEEYKKMSIDVEAERRKIAEERKKLEQEQKELEEAMEILKQQQEIDMRRRKLEEEKVIIRRAYLAEQRITHPEDSPKERTPLPPKKGFLDDMAKIEHDNDWTEFFNRYNDAEENLHKVEPEPATESHEFDINKFKNNDIELEELNLPKERPVVPRDSSKHNKKKNSEAGCCIIM
jgi:hypothetical protein